MRCPSCGREIQPEGTSCPSCGSTLPAEHDGPGFKNPFAPTTPPTPEDGLRRGIRAALEDGTLTETEEGELRRLQDELGIPAETARKIFAEEDAAYKARQASAPPERSSTPPVSTGDASIADSVVKGDIVQSRDQHVHYHGEEGERLHATSKGEFCASCGQLLKDDYFRCRSCERLCCSKCRAENSVLCKICQAKQDEQDPKAEAERELQQKQTEDSDLRFLIGADIQGAIRSLTSWRGGTEPYIREVAGVHSVKWQRAADLEWPEGQWLLGRCFELGVNTKPDAQVAIRLYRLAAEQGMAMAQRSLGLCFEWGKGVRMDFREARRWYGKAAEQGFAAAEYDMGRMYSAAGNRPEGINWVLKAAHQGLPYAQTYVGHCFMEGEDVPQDLRKAAYWFAKAAEKGDPEGQFQMGHVYLSGDVVPRDEQEAFGWFQRAAEQGHVSAKYMLGELQG